MEIMKTTNNTLVHKASIYTRYARLVLWLFRQGDTSYMVLMKRIQQLLKTNGSEFTVVYLKECVRLCNHAIAGQPTSCPQNLEGGPRVASRRGLPLIVPGSLRLRMEARDPVTIRIVLTFLSVFRIIKCKGVLKLGTITGPFTGLTEELAPWEVGYTFTRFAPFLKGIPTLKDLKVDRPLILKTAGPNFKTSILGAPLDSIAWKCLASEASKTAFKILSDHTHSDLWNFLKLEWSTVSGYLPYSILKEEGITKVFVQSFGKVKMLKLGKLSKKDEPAGKIRIFAIADVWTQSVLKPYHEYIFSILRNIPQDGTFDQAGPLVKLRERLNSRPNKWVASYDLSAATDRLPIKVQVQVLSQLFTREVAEAWRVLLVDRDWWLGSDAFRYSVGQPMGALSSWASLALTHHFLVQTAARRVGKTTWFEDYALLGDDIVIADKAVAESYHQLMTVELGVEINLSKSIMSEIGVVEFAKRLADPIQEFTPIGPKNVLGVLKNPAYLPQLFLDLLGKGGDLDWSEVSEQLKQLYDRKDLLRVSKGGLEALTWTVLQPFGFIPFPGVASEKITTSLMEEEIDSWTLIEAMNLAAQYQYDKESDKAIEKTTASINALRRVINRWEALGEVTPPSFQWVLHECSKLRLEMLVDYSNPTWNYVDPSGLTPAEVLKKILESNKPVSPLDNMLLRPKVVKPRIKRVSLEFFRLVRRHAKYIMMM